MYPTTVSLLCNNCRLNLRRFSLRCIVTKHNVLTKGTFQIRNTSSKESIRNNLKNGPSLQDFIKSSITSDGNSKSITSDTLPYLTSSDWQGLNRKGSVRNVYYCHLWNYTNRWFSFFGLHSEASSRNSLVVPVRITLVNYLCTYNYYR